MTPIGEIKGNPDGGAATSVSIDATIPSDDSHQLTKPQDASVADISTDGLPVGGAEAEWTVFVYGHADHNLSPSMVKDLEEMSRAKLNDKIQVVALVDYNASLENGSEKFPTGVFWYRIQGNGQPAKEISKHGELDMDDPSVLATAIHHAFTAYPAKRYGLIMWDHGGAWTSGFGGDSQDGTGEPTGMAVESAANAMRTAIIALGLKGEKPLEFITFDTCLMGGAEEVAAFQGIAKLYTANAEIDFGDGLDYAETLSYLAANPGTSVTDFGKNETRIWEAHHAAAGGLDLLFRSHAVWDTARTPKIEETMKALGTAVAAAGQARSVARALYLSSPEYFAGTGDEDAVVLRDVGNILQTLKSSENQGVATAAGRVLEEVGNARVGMAAGDLRKDQAGLHIFGGAASRLTDDQMAQYPLLAGPWEKATGWGSAVLAKVKAAAPMNIDKVTATLTSDTSGAEKAAMLTINSPSKDTAYIEGFLLQKLANGDAMAWGTIGHAFVGPGESQIRWTGQGTYLVATPRNIPVSVTPFTFAQQGQTIRTPYMAVQALLSMPDEDPATVFMLVNSDNGSATHMALKTDDSSWVVLSLAEVAEMGDAGKVMITPILTTFDAKKEEMGEALSPVSVTAPGSGVLSFRREPVPAGGYVILGYAEDFWGNGDFEGLGFEVAGP